VLPAEVNVATSRNPFAGTRIDSTAPVGMTLREMVAVQGFRESAAYGVQVVLNGEIVPDRMLDHVKPKAGTQVIVRVVPHGGDSGKAVLSIVISVLVIAAAVFTGGAALSAFAAGTGGFGAVAGSAAGLIGGLSGVVTGIQSLAAPPPDVYVGSIPESQDSAALQGTRNSVRLYKPIRTVLGRYRVYPDLLGKPFVEQVGSDSILRLLMCFGYGPLDITDIKIGETSIDDIPGIQYNVLQGWDDDGELTIFRDESDADSGFQPSLPRENPEVAILTSGLGPAELSFDLQFVGGLIAFSDSTGRPAEVTVVFTVEQRELGSTSWNNIGTPTRGLGDNTGITQISPGRFSIRLRERGTVTRGLRWTVPVGSTPDVAHQIRVTRISTTTAGDTIVSDARITVLRTIKPHLKTTIPNLAKIEIEVNANDAGLSGVLDNLSAICTSIAPIFDSLTNTWGAATGNASTYNVTMFPTRNAAWLFAQVLRGPANSRPIADSRIDGFGILGWAGNLAGTGTNPISGEFLLARNIDAVVDFTTTARKLLADIAGGGRAALNIVDGKYSVVQDVPRTAITQHFSPRNSSGFGGAKAFKRSPHALRVAFVNPDKGYQKDERIVYDDGYSEAGNIGAIWDFSDSQTTSPSYGGTAFWNSASGIDVTTNGHSMRIENNGGTQAYFYLGASNAAGTTFSGTDNPIVRMRIRKTRSAASSWRGWMFWSNDTLWDGNSYPFFSDAGASLVWDEPDWKNGDWITVEFDMSSFDTWTGETIRHLRFDMSYGGPATGNDIYEIDWIRVDDGTQPATEFMDLSLWGVADADQAWRDARYHIASHRLRPEVFTITADVEHIVCNRGDLVRVSHDVIGVGYGGARIKAVTNVGGAFVSATMDEEFYFNPNSVPPTNYAARLRSSDGSELLVNVANQGETSDQLVAESATSYGVSAAPAVGDHLLFGERETESLLCIVQRVSPRNDLTAVLELIEYNAAVYEHGAIPEYETPITIPIPPTLQNPEKPVLVGQPISDETAASYSSSGSPEPQILVNVNTPQGSEGTFSRTTHFQAQFRLNVNGAVAAWTNLPQVEAIGDTRIIVRPVDEGSVYDIRIRAISQPAGTTSDFVYVNNYTVVGLSTPPPAPTDLRISNDAIRWSYGLRPNDFAGFIVKYQSGSDANWQTGILLSESLITDNFVAIGGRLMPGLTTIMVRAVDLSGNESGLISAVRLIRSLEDRSISQESVWTNVWAGVKTNCTHNTSSTYLEADVSSSSLFYSGGSTATFWSGTGSSDFWGLVTYKDMNYLQNAAMYQLDGPSWPTTQPLPGRQRFKSLEVEGSNFTIEYAPVVSIGLHPVTFAVQYTYGTFRPWPGVRELQEIEFPLSAGFEMIGFRITILGGTTQGKIKAAHYVVEGLPKTYRETISVSASGSTVDLTGELWRKITNVTVTPNNTANTAQGALFGEAYNLDAAQTTTSPYELTGPTVRLYDAEGAAATGTATVVIEGY